MRKYTKEEHRFFEEFVPGHSYKEIQKEFNRRFDWNIEIEQVKGCVARWGLNTGRSGCFEKGCVPANKGQKMSPEVYEKCKDTMFKKGNTPINYRPIGSERVTKDGYIEIKVADPNKWMLKHRWAWEQKNGPVPKGSIVIFKDNDKQNCCLDNLMLITRAENARLNQLGLYTAQGEYKEVAVNIAKLRIVANERKKHGKT